MPSLYSKYLKEREDKEILETDDGFVSYKILNTGECYIQDIYIVPEMRKSGLAVKMQKQVVEIAKAKDCHTLLGSVCFDTNEANRNLKLLLNDNWTVHAITGNTVFLNKKIEAL